MACGYSTIRSSLSFYHTSIHTFCHVAIPPCSHTAMQQAYRCEDGQSDISKLWEDVHLKCTSHLPRGLHGNHLIGSLLLLALCEEWGGDGVRGGEVLSAGWAEGCLVPDAHSPQSLQQRLLPTRDGKGSNALRVSTTFCSMCSTFRKEMD